MVTHGFLGPQPPYHIQVFLEPLHASAFGHVERIELHLPIAETDTEHEVAPSDDIEGCHRLRHVDGIVQIEEQYAETRGHLTRFRHQLGKEHNNLKLLVVALVEVMLPHEQRILASIAIMLGHYDLFLQGAYHVLIKVLLVGEVLTDFELGHQVAIMGSAAASTATWIALGPKPPVPITATVLPGSTLAVLITAPTPVVTPQPTRAARSSG